MRAGLGPPPAGLPQLNVSRLLDLAACGRHFEILYLDGMELDLPAAPPLETGTVWHGLHELWTDNGWVGEEAHTQRLAAEATENMDDEVGSAWINRAWPEYIKKFPVEPPGGKPIGAETPVWFEHDGYYIVGKIDKPCVKALPDGSLGLWEGQVKTTTPRKDLGVFCDEYRRSWHCIAYGLALHHATEKDYQREFGIPKPTYMGVWLDVAIKHPYPTVPVNTTKDGRITPAYQVKLDAYKEKLLNWSSSLFYDQEIPFDALDPRIDHVLHQFSRLMRLMERGILIENPSMCDNWWRRTCPYKGRACEERYYDDRYRKRESDYVTLSPDRSEKTTRAGGEE